jgi:hypothetical protein
MNHDEQLDYEPSAEELEKIGHIAEPDTASYHVSRYRKIGHLFNFHSWLPLYVDYLNPNLSLDPEHLPVSLGVSLISQNRLSTAVSQIGYEYSDGYHMFHSGIKLKGRYPIFNLYLDYGGEPNVLLLNEAADSSMTLPRDLGFTAQVYVPFRINTGKFISIVQPRIDYNYRRDVQYIEEAGEYKAGAHYMYYSLYGTSYLRKGTRDILPRLGLAVSGGYYHAPFGNRVYGAVSSFGFTGYLPGFLKHQTIRISVRKQNQYPLDMSQPAFRNLISLPRGMHGVLGEILTRTSADYVFPILYPDLEISSLLYLKRIRGGIWADYMAGTNVVIRDPSPHYEDRNYSSVGIDLLADLNILRIPFPISVGGRYIFIPETGKSMFEMIYSIDIN